MTVPAKTPPARDLRDWITPEDLNVAPALLGQPLARPWRRAWAIGVDIAAVGLLSSLANGWLLAAMALLGGAYLWAQRRGTPVGRWVWAVAAVLLVIAAQQAHLRRTSADPAAPTLEDKVEALAEAIAAHEPASGAASAPSRDQIVALERRIDTLERELAQARKSGAAKLRDDVNHWLDEAGISFGWGLLYFSFLPAWGRGQTPGKWLFGLRVVELTGKPMGVFPCLKRYGGYAAGMATGGLGFLQVFWDPNRQAIQDKTAHTVVIDERRSDRLPPERWPAGPAGG